MKKNIFLIIITVSFYLINQVFKYNYSNVYVNWFMTCYFNDIVGSIAFIAYCNILLEYRLYNHLKLNQIIALLFLCGLFWEYIAPLFISYSISDPLDVVAYISGGLIYYWLITKQAT